MIVWTLAIHSLVRWLIVLLGVASLVKSAIGLVSNRSWEKLDSDLLRYLNLVMGVQFILGVVLLFVKAESYSALGTSAWQAPLEHFFTNTIAILVAGMTLSRTRKATTAKGKFVIALVGVLLSAILIYLGVARVGGWSF